MGWRWALLGVFALAVTAATVVAVVFPSVASTTCPGCYGMQELEPNVYVDRDLSADQRSQVFEVVHTARQRVSAFYNGQESWPRILACLTDDCYHRIGGGGERGIGVLNRAVMLSPRGINAVIASHEMSHVELHQRLGSVRDQVPQWFDEGLAVVVSEDSRYLAPKSATHRCLVSDIGTLPVSLADWLHAATADEKTYARAACRVSRWVEANGGSNAVPTLLRRLVAGEPFRTVMTG